MKIAFLIRSFNYGGAERQLIALARGLSDARFEVSVLYFYAGGPLENELKNSEVEMICLEKRGRRDVVGFLWRLIKSVRRLQPDVLHGYLDIPNLLALFLKPFCARAKIVWGMRNSNLKLFSKDTLTDLSFRLERFLARFVDLIIINSYAGQSYHLSQGFPAGKMLVIPNGIDVERFKPDRVSGARIRSEWGISENTKLIGLVGRIDPQKDHPVFLRAAAILCKEYHDDVRFVCIGDGGETYKDEMLRLSVRLGVDTKVIWKEPRMDMPAVYNALDVATSTSLVEGFSNVVGEAMACGVPCVATDVGDSSLIIGPTGRTVPSQSPERVAAAWREYLDAGDAKAGPEMRARIVEHFGTRQLIARTARALLDLRQGVQHSSDAEASGSLPRKQDPR